MKAHTTSEELHNDALTMALRLLGEDESTMSSECRAVVDKWRPRCEALLSDNELDGINIAQLMRDALEKWNRFAEQYGPLLNRELAEHVNIEFRAARDEGRQCLEKYKLTGESHPTGTA